MNWKNRVKGRDWFDFEWYIRQGTPLNLSHFVVRAIQSVHLQDNTLSEPEFRQMFQQRIDGLEVSAAVKDISRFVTDAEALNIWSREYFKDLSQMLKITN